MLPAVTRSIALLVSVAILPAAGCASRSPGSPPPPLPAPPALRLEPVVASLPAITAIAHAGDGSGRLFLAAQRGQVLELRDGRLNPVPWLDLGDRVRCCGEQGLLGLAFDPGFARNGYLYVSYTDAAGASVIARYRQRADARGADPGSAATVLRVAQPTPIHNGGALAFGPDRRLYIALGDGGHFGLEQDHSGRDPEGRAQSRATLLGKILRLDVSQGLPYRVPPDNPFAAAAGARPEIWAYGLRNPWRISFDRTTGDLYIADVGASQWEEINRLAPGAGGGNFGWSAMQGPDCFTEFRCDPHAYTPPILLYDHADGCAVIGGYRYRGAAIPALRGVYLYGDFCSGTLWGGYELADGRWAARKLLATGLHISTLGEDESGEIYLADYGAEDGALYRLTTAPAPRR